MVTATLDRNDRLLAFAVVCLVSGPVAATENPIRFNRDVLPILANHCFSCHGFDQAKRKAGLRLDQQTESRHELKSGVRAIVPGDLQQSELWTRVKSNDRDLRMPPTEAGSPLSARELDTLQALDSTRRGIRETLGLYTTAAGCSANHRRGESPGRPLHSSTPRD